MTETSPASRFALTPQTIRGVTLIEPKRIGDARGYFSRLFCSDELKAAGWVWPVLQINHSYTASVGTVRGMHYQAPPHAEAKLVSCLRGRVWDVAVDLRPDSDTYMQWCSHELSAENATTMLIPPGCAHGFQALTSDVELVYIHSVPYSQTAENGVNPRDPTLGINWPIPISVISEKDKTIPFLTGEKDELNLRNV